MDNHAAEPPGIHVLSTMPTPVYGESPIHLQANVVDKEMATVNGVWPASCFRDALLGLTRLAEQIWSSFGDSGCFFLGYLRALILLRGEWPH